MLLITQKIIELRPFQVLNNPTASRVLSRMSRIRRCFYSFYYSSQGEEEKEKKKEQPKENNPSGRGCVARNSIFFTGDFIYWKSVEDDLVIVEKSPNLLAGRGVLGLVQSPTPHFAYNPGPIFKLFNSLNDSAAA